jgi:hypothetical protein
MYEAVRQTPPAFGLQVLAGPLQQVGRPICAPLGIIYRRRIVGIFDKYADQPAALN